MVNSNSAEDVIPDENGPFRNVPDRASWREIAESIRVRANGIFCSKGDIPITRAAEFREIVASAQKAIALLTQEVRPAATIRRGE